MLQQRRPVGLAAVWLALWLAIMLVAACSAGVSGLLDSFAPAPTEIQAYPTKRPTPVPTVDPCARLAGRPAECPPLADYTPQNPECSPWKDYGIIEIYSLPDIDQARACWLGENYPQWAFQHLEGCQRCQDFAYHEQHGEFAPVGSYYKDGKVYKNATAYFRNFRHLRALLDSYVALVEECTVRERRGRTRVPGFQDPSRSICIDKFRRGHLR